MRSLGRHSVACAVACLATLAAFAGGALEPLERPLIDLRMAFLERPADPQPVLIEIDPRSVHEVGRWPWPRSLHALLLDRLTAAEVRADANVGQGLRFLRQLVAHLPVGFVLPVTATNALYLVARRVHCRVRH